MSSERHERVHGTDTHAPTNDLPEGTPSGGSPAAEPDVALVSAALALISGCLVYVIVHAARLPVLLYLPELGSWSFSAPSETIAMRFYGGLPYLLAAFALGWSAGRLSAISAHLGAGPAAGRLGRLAVLALVSAMTYFAVAELSHWAG